MIKSPKFIILLLCLYYLFVSRSFGQAEKELNPPEYIKTISFKTSQENYLTNLPIVKLGETFTLDIDVLLNSLSSYCDDFSCTRSIKFSTSKQEKRDHHDTLSSLIISSSSTSSLSLFSSYDVNL